MPALDLRSDAATPPAREAPPAHRVDPRVATAVVATVVAMLPALLVLAKFAFRDVLLTGDFGVIDARVRDVWHGPVPLLGPYSNGWSHPGPLYYYVLAPLDALFAGASWTIVASGAILHIVAIGLTARLAWRRGGLGLTLLLLAVLALATLGATDRVLLDPWNPHVAMPFFALFVLQVWSVMLRDRWQLLGAAIVGSFLVQAHLGYAPLVGAAFLVAAVSVLRDARRTPDTLRPWARPLGVSAGVALVLWLPPIWEQLTGDPGNVTLITRYFREHPEGQIGLRAGAGTFAALFRPLPVWLGGPERFEPLTFQPRPESLWWLLVPLGLLAAAGFAALHRRLAAEGRLVALVGVLTGVGILALSRVKDAAWTYMSLWRLPLAVLVVAVAGWTLWRAWPAPPALVRSLGVVALCGAVLGGAVPISVDILRTRHVASFHDDVAAVVDQVRDRAIDEPLLVRNVAPALRGVAPTIVDVLDQRGVAVRVDPRGGRAWGSQRTATPDQVERVWIVTEDGMRGAQLRAVPGARVIARTSPLPEGEERELSRLQRDLAEQLYDAGRADLVPWLDYRDFVPLVAKQVPSVDPTKIARVEALVREAVAIGGCRCTVVEFRPDELPGALTDG